MHSLVLYNSARSTCSLRVRLTLAHKGLDYEERKVSLDRNEHLSEAFRRLNPDALVPVLVVDGHALAESSAINEYLDDAWPEPALRPLDAIERARMRAWVHYFDEVTIVALRYLSFQQFYLPVVRAVPAAQRNDFARTLPMREGFWREVSDAGFSSDRLALEQRRVAQTLQRMDNALQERGWLCGDALSLADIAVIPCVVRMQDLGLDALIDRYPNVRQWFTRAAALPAFAKAYYEGARFVRKMNG